MASWTRVCAIALCLLSGWALGMVELDAGTQSVSVAHDLRYFRDDSAALNLGQVLALPASSWATSQGDVFSQGYNHAAWWLRFDLMRREPVPDHDLLEIAYPVLDDVEVWVMQRGAVATHYKMGDKLAFASRPIPHRYFLVPLYLQAGEPYTVFLRVHTSSAVQVPLTVWNKNAYVAHDQYRLVAEGLYCGAMLVMVLYNFFVFLVVRERNYFYYVMYVLSILMFIVSLNGMAFQFLWPESTTWNDQAIIFSLSGTVLFGTIFTLRFLNLPQHLPRLVPVSRLVAGAALLLMLGAFVFPYDELIRVVIGVAVAACLSALTAGIVRWRAGDASARYYALAWSSMLMGGIVLALDKFHLLPQNLITENAAQTGSALEVVLLSFALAERINSEKRLRFNAQQDALEAERRARHAQAEALDAQRRANEQLEARVQERTVALEEANRRLAALSATDQLTGLKNRRFLDDLLHEEFQRCFRYGRPIALLLLDIDHFKRFNDTYGHVVGDECLRAVAGALRYAVRTQVDQVARYGGEEFCVVLPETDAEGARVVAERIREAVEALEFRVGDRHVPVTVSVGVAAMIPGSTEDAQMLVLSTDKALYQAKEAGRNRVRVAGLLASV
ncbi:MAG TPA: 7TM diverse intracellular signaling domain-containing protein [Moraxellaceae bacterium]|nr:7TM diverse intracellular signaling domain-containing protein [Moraxellaceae bacterium]